MTVFAEANTLSQFGCDRLETVTLRPSAGDVEPFCCWVEMMERQTHKIGFAANTTAACGLPADFLVGKPAIVPFNPVPILLHRELKSGIGFPPLAIASVHTGSPSRVIVF